ncbi:MAG: hypothetical protein HZB22_07315 [Deltaproteobacteria bacterium]|nr:hypothetical protein [Deltaproteobacteria bacterium]
MPGWVCEECGSEFWGWSLCCRPPGGGVKSCPACGGALVCSHNERKDPGGDKTAA